MIYEYMYQADRGRSLVCTLCHAALPETEPESLWRGKWGFAWAMTTTIPVVVGVIASPYEGIYFRYCSNL